MLIATFGEILDQGTFYSVFARMVHPLRQYSRGRHRWQFLRRAINENMFWHHCVMVNAGRVSNYHNCLFLRHTSLYTDNIIYLSLSLTPFPFSHFFHVLSPHTPTFAHKHTHAHAPLSFHTHTHTHTPMLYVFRNLRPCAYKWLLEV